MREAEDIRTVRICVIRIVERVVNIPEVGVDGDDTQAFAGSVSISAVVRSSVLSLGAVDPAVGLPTSTRGAGSSRTARWS